MSQGRELELLVKRALEAELQGGKLGIDPRAASVHWHKPYPSNAGRPPIFVDVALEICREPGSSPYLVWVWECKDYNRLVPVDDVEEFHGKLEQLGVHRTKGTMICRNGFQKGALTAAKHWGIGSCPTAASFGYSRHFGFPLERRSNSALLSRIPGN